MNWQLLRSLIWLQPNQKSLLCRFTLIYWTACAKSQRSISSMAYIENHPPSSGPRRAGREKQYHHYSSCPYILCSMHTSYVAIEMSSWRSSHVYGESVIGISQAKNDSVCSFALRMNADVPRYWYRMYHTINDRLFQWRRNGICFSPQLSLLNIIDAFQDGSNNRAISSERICNFLIWIRRRSYFTLDTYICTYIVAWDCEVWSLWKR